jgi:demethylmenaquinone methyltransferase/2-methoxy-6-polyprenyl-1,4-benzoquinol methylase
MLGAALTCPPPLDLDAALDDKERKQEAVNWVFDRVAQRYDLGNHVMSLGMHRYWKRLLVERAEIEPHHRVLDIACGTGDITWMIAQRAVRGEVVGTDINERMMALATSKKPEGELGKVSFLTADAGSLPLEDNSFDRVTCVYAGRGFPDWPAVVREVYRVLRPGGTFWNLDFGRPPVGIVDRTYRGWLLSSGALLGLALHRSALAYMYIPKSMERYKGQRWLEQEMTKAGFETNTIETTLGLMAYNFGRKPE